MAHTHKRSALAEWLGHAPAGGPRIYRTIRFRFHVRPRTLRTGLTEAEAQAHCSKAATHGPGWFDGYDYMRGYRPAKGE